jgi:hypothetical protein
MDGRKDELDEGMIRECWRHHREIVNLFIITGYDKIKVTTRNVGRLIDVLAKTELREEAKEAN